MKRIIFSIYREDVDKHTSASSYKRNQFKKYKEQIIANHKAYAKLCGADYELITDVESNYDIIQFQKIELCNQFAKKYDEVLYIDFDVIINTDISFFEHFNLNTLCMYNVPVIISNKVLSFRESDPKWEWHPMDMYVKACAKNAMLQLEGGISTNYVMNTGVIGCNKYSISSVDFKECSDIFFEAKKDNIYSNKINRRWIPNNEVYISYMVEKYNLPYTNISLQWNFILDDTYKDVSAGAYFYHVVNKEFKKIFNPLA